MVTSRINSVLSAAGLYGPISHPETGTVMGMWAQVTVGLSKSTCLTLVRGDDAVHAVLEADPDIYALPDVADGSEENMEQVRGKLRAQTVKDIPGQQRARLRQIIRDIGARDVGDDEDLETAIEAAAQALDPTVNFRGMGMRLR
jgi:hypothetical protein